MVRCVKMQVGMKLDVFISIQDKIILILYKKVLILYISFPTKTAPGHIQNVKSCQACSVISIWNRLLIHHHLMMRSDRAPTRCSDHFHGRAPTLLWNLKTYLIFSPETEDLLLPTSRTAVLYCLDLGDVLFCCLVYF